MPENENKVKVTVSPSGRRVWYIDVGNLSKAKAEQYVKEIMENHQ